MADEKPDDEMPTQTGGATISDRIAAFQMLDRMSEATQAQKCFRLSLVGFGRAEIAAMLQTTPAVVSQSIYSEKNKLKKKSNGRQSS